MNKQAILVLGSESSGTRLATEILIANGYFGDSTHEQRIDDIQNPSELKNIDRIVWRRSLPHGITGTFPIISDLQIKLNDLGFNDIKVVVTIRDLYCTEKSVNNRHNRYYIANDIKQAYYSIFSYLYNNMSPFYILTYESLINNPKGIQESLLRFAEVQITQQTIYINITDGNSKYL